MSQVPTAARGSDPTMDDARDIVAAIMGESPQSIVRFPLGSSHFVFDVEAASGRRAVLRLSRQEDLEAARGAAYWSGVLRPLGVPLPELLHADLSLERYPFPVMLLERLPGADLGNVYGHLSRRALRTLAERLAAIQDVVTRLPRGTGYGYAASRDGPFRHQTWRSVVAAHLARSRSRIRAARVVDESVIDVVEAAAERLGYLDRVPAVPFLHDITTKNVIVHEGRLSGIVDVDDLCFGDPLLLIALIRMALLAHGRDQVYVEIWIDILRPDAEQRAALDFYTLECCADFMGELGQRFNRTEAPVDPAYLARLHALYTGLRDRVAMG
jgi:aminoglycoside phosphotransferase (APT) family kinase protein